MYGTVDATVRAVDLAPGQSLVAELERRGGDTLWEGALLCLGPLAARPAYNLPEQAGVERMRLVARSTPDAVSALVMELMATHRDNGAQAAHLVWSAAGPDVRRAGMLQLLLTLARAVGGSDGGRLTPAQTVLLIRQFVDGLASGA